MAQFVAIVVKYCQNILYIEMTFDVDDTAATVLFNSLERIESIVIHNCDDFTRNSFRFLKSKCAELRELDLCCLPSFTDDALLAISRSCLNLRVLNVSTCQMIGYKGVIAMLRSCPLLEEVQLSNMPAAVAAAAAKVLAAEQHCTPAESTHYRQAEHQKAVGYRSEVLALISAARHRLCGLG